LRNQKALAANLNEAHHLPDRPLRNQKALAANLNEAHHLPDRPQANIEGRRLIRALFDASNVFSYVAANCSVAACLLLAFCNLVCRTGHKRTSKAGDS